DSTVRLLRGALHAAYRQMNMVTELIDLARLELGTYELQRDEVDLTQLIRDRLEIDNYAITVKGLRLETDLQPLLISGDRDLLNRVISGLIENTLKFTVREDLLRVTVGREGTQGIVRFSDSGRMIQESFEQDMMKRAPQWEKRQAGNRTSVGMSLPFVYQVALAHGGTFAAHSDEATRLTSFTLTLPAEIA
ncbi:MAG: HAMP domain-containing histidine kinase, partial [Anaerolineae bacterium]|nr:HAMP domain-containing histidine kinase [Anaerolineae bacterium]